MTLEAAKVLLFLANGLPQLTGDAARYWSMADAAVTGDWERFCLTGGTFRPPGYPLFLALVASASPSGWAQQVATAANLTLLPLATIATGLLCALVTGERLALLLGLAVSSCLLSRYYIAAHLLCDPLFALVVCCSFGALCAHLDRPRWTSAVPLGVLLGIATLIKPIAQFLPLLSLPFLLLAGTGNATRPPPHLARRIAFGGTVIVSAGLTVLPWALVNLQRHGSLFLSKFNGRAFWCVTFEPGGAELPPGKGSASTFLSESHLLSRTNAKDQWQVYLVLRGTGFTETEADDLMFAACTEAIAEHPLKYACAVGLNFVRFWTTRREIYRPLGRYPGGRGWIQPTLGAAKDWLTRRLAGPTSALGAFMGPAALGALAWTIAARRRRKQRLIAGALATWMVYFAAAPAVAVYPLYRYRLAIEPLMVLAIVSAIVWSRREPGPQSANDPVG